MTCDIGACEVANHQVLFVPLVHCRSQASSQFTVVNSTLLVPPSEFDYLRIVINPSTGLAPWTTGPSGLFLDTPVRCHPCRISAAARAGPGISTEPFLARLPVSQSGYASTGSLVFDSASVVQGSWMNVTLRVLDADREVQAKLVWTGAHKS